MLKWSFLVCRVSSLHLKCTAFLLTGRTGILFDSPLKKFCLFKFDELGLTNQFSSIFGVGHWIPGVGPPPPLSRQCPKFVTFFEAFPKQLSVVHINLCRNVQYKIGPFVLWRLWVIKTKGAEDLFLHSKTCLNKVSQFSQSLRLWVWLFNYSKIKIVHSIFRKVHSFSVGWTHYPKYIKIKII